MSERLVLGDEILEMNGESFAGLTHREGVAAIRKHKKEGICLHMLVARHRTSNSQRRFDFTLVHDCSTDVARML